MCDIRKCATSENVRHPKNARHPKMCDTRKYAAPENMRHVYLPRGESKSNMFVEPSESGSDEFGSDELPSSILISIDAFTGAN